MEAIFEKMLKTALSNLRQLEGRGLIKFKVIHGKEEHGSLQVAEQKAKRPNKLNLPKGTLRNHVMPWIQSVQPGELVEIPIADYPAENIRGNASAWATEKWGRGTYTTTINRKTNYVELYRYPLEELDE